MNKIIRLATAADAEACREINAYYINETVITFDYEVPSLSEYKTKIESILNSHPFFVFEKDNNVIGYAYGSFFRSKRAYQWCAETTIYLHPENREVGIGSALYNILLFVMKEQGYVKLLAGVTLPNIPSINFHLKFGYELFSVQKNIGYKFDKWHDVQWLEKNLYDEPIVPKDILSVESVLKSDKAKRFFADLHNSL